MMGANSNEFLIKASSSLSFVPTTLYGINKISGTFTKTWNID